LQRAVAKGKNLSPNISLAGKVAVVTGGSRGIGAAIVKLFVAAGAKVVFSYRKDRAAADRVIADCGKSNAIAVKVELSRMKDAKKLIGTCIKKFGRLDILVGNGGIWNADDCPIDKMTERQWDEMIDINLKGVYSVTHYAVPQMKKQRSGRIIHISSTAGQRGESFHSHYGASKGGVISFVKGLSTELARHGILVNCVAPGWVDTDMARPALEAPNVGAEIKRVIPLGRVGTPEEIAGPVLFLAGEHSTFITGEILNVNGGAVLVG
jgi:3-oxoacyl-[acyl-carrier protein] reductase